MKKNLLWALLAFAFLSFLPAAGLAQLTGNVVNVQALKTKWPDKGTMAQRDSLVSLYVENVIRKNEHILSHREYTHFFTASNQDYLVIEEYKDMAGVEASFLRNTELEKLGWPDEAKRKAYFDLLDSYFENWHGDALYRTNAKLSKN